MADATAEASVLSTLSRFSLDFYCRPRCWDGPTNLKDALEEQWDVLSRRRTALCESGNGHEVLDVPLHIEYDIEVTNFEVEIFKRSKQTIDYRELRDEDLEKTADGPDTWWKKVIVSVKGLPPRCIEIFVSSVSAEELAMRPNRKIHVAKLHRFDYVMAFPRRLDVQADRALRHYTIREISACVTVLFWETFKRIHSGSWDSGSVQNAGRVWRPRQSEMEKLWRKSPPLRHKFSFYFEVEWQKKEINIKDRIENLIAESAAMVPRKLFPPEWCEPTARPTPFDVVQIGRAHDHGNANSPVTDDTFETLGTAVDSLRFLVQGRTRANRWATSSAVTQTRPSAVISPARPFGAANGGNGAGDRLTRRRGSVQETMSELTWERFMVKRVVTKPSGKGAAGLGDSVRAVKVMNLKLETIRDIQETLKLIKAMGGARPRSEKSSAASSSVAEDSVDDAATSFNSRSPDRVVASLVGDGSLPATLQALEGVTMQLQRKKIKKRFRSVGLFVREEALENRKSRGQVYLLITAPNFVLARKAAEVGLPLRVQPQAGRDAFVGDFTPSMFMREAPQHTFFVETANQPYPYDWFWDTPDSFDPANHFSGVNRCRLLMSLITGSNNGFGVSSKESENGTSDLRIMELQALGTVTAFFPLHTAETLRYLRTHWAKPWKISWSYYMRHPLLQDTTVVREYFGDSIAFYFEWLEYYTKWLVAPCVVGTLVYCSKSIFKMQSLRGFLQIKEEFDLYPYFALFMTLWAPLFLEFWKRKNVRLLYLWNIQQGHTRDLARPEFVGALRNDFSENQQAKMLRSVLNPEKRPGEGAAFSLGDLKNDLAMHDELFYYPPVKRTLKHLITYPALILLTASLLSLMGWVYVGGLFFNLDTVGQNFGNQQGTSQWQSKVPEDEYYALVGAANGVAIPLLNVLYKKVAVTANKWELHRSTAEYNESLALKLFIFQFVNSYASLFFIAFYSQSFSRLQTQLFFIMLGQFVLQNFMELGMPALKKKFRTQRSTTQRQHKEKLAQQDLDDDASSAFILDDQAAGEAMKAKREGLQEVYDEFSLCEDYLEMIMQFGYVTLFVVAMPLTPLLALVNNIIEVRVDASKLCFLTQRPDPRTATGIGFWLPILQFMSMTAIVTNFAIIGITKLDSSSYTAPYPTLLEVMLDCTNGDTSFPCGNYDSLWILVILEHFVLLIRAMAGWLLSGDQSAIATDEFKERYYQIRAQSVLSYNDAKDEDAEEGPAARI